MRIDPEVMLTQATTIKIYDYWRARRGTRIMPARSDIQPKDMRGLLPHAGLIEAVGNDYRVRLAGTHAEEIMGQITGKLFHEFLTPEIEARWRSVCDEARRTRGPLSVTGRLAFQGKNWLQTETFVGPLGEEGQEITMLLLGFVAWSALEGAA